MIELCMNSLSFLRLPSVAVLANGGPPLQHPQGNIMVRAEPLVP